MNPNSEIIKSLLAMTNQILHFNTELSLHICLNLALGVQNADVSGFSISKYLQYCIMEYLHTKFMFTFAKKHNLFAQVS